jgi:hypothetical protein
MNVAYLFAGWYLRPTLTPLRILFLVGYVTGLVVYVAFSAAIVSALAVVSLPIGSRSALLSSLLPIYADSKSSTMAYIVEVNMLHCWEKSVHC